jgi:hypothetical protein
MAVTKPALKKSVTIDQDVIKALLPERTRNLSATVNEGLELLAALDAQQALVDEWESKHGRFTDDELKPFLEAAIKAQVNNVMRTLRTSEGEQKTHRPARRRGPSSRV